MNPFAFISKDLDLVIVLGFVAVVIIVKTIGRVQQQRMWHDTARIALDRGQPLPPAMPNRDDYREMRQWASCQRRNRRGGWTRGLVWIAVAVGLYFIEEGDSRRWAILPLCIGVAWVISGLFDPPQSRDDTTLPPSA